MKSLRFFIILVFFVLFSSSFCFAQFGEQDGKAYMGTGTFFKASSDLRALYAASIYPIENLSEPQLPLPNKLFSVNANIVMMAEGATIINATSPHDWWQIENKKVSKENGISIVSFSINGKWNPLRQPTNDWPEKERGCWVFQIEYQIDNPTFGLFIAINNYRYSFGIVLEREGDRLEFGERPGYKFPLFQAQNWGTKNGRIATSWGSLKRAPK